MAKRPKTRGKVVLLTAEQDQTMVDLYAGKLSIREVAYRMRGDTGDARITYSVARRILMERGVELRDRNGE